MSQKTKRIECLVSELTTEQRWEKAIKEEKPLHEIPTWVAATSVPGLSGYGNSRNEAIENLKKKFRGEDIWDNE